MRYHHRMAKPRQVPFRERHPGTLDHLVKQAAYYGRSLNEELNLAAEGWIHRNALALLDDPVVRKELGTRQVNAERKRITDEVKTLEARAFTRPGISTLLPILERTAPKELPLTT